MREQKTKAQVKKKKEKLKDDTHLLSPLAHPVINQPPSTYPIFPSFVITVQWA